jgi:hypothetical protein
MLRREPEVSKVSSLVPTDNKSPRLTLLGWASDEVKTLIPLGSSVV